MWRTVAESDLVTQLSTSLADQVGTGELPVLNNGLVQDVLNAVLRRQQQLLFPLPCSWNVQMSDNSLSDSLCYLHTAGRSLFYGRALRADLTRLASYRFSFLCWCHP